MPSKTDKMDGVFAIECKIKNKVYIGKSNGVGVAKRSAKSKLKKGTFHNKETQLDFNKYPSSFEFCKVILLEEEDEKNLTELLEAIKKEYLGDGFIPYNDIEIIHHTPKTQINEVDVYGIDELDYQKKDIIDRILDAFERGANVQELSQHLTLRGI